MTNAKLIVSGLSSALLLSACLQVHIHTAPPLEDPAAVASTEAAPADQEHLIHGRVVDREGRPVRARVAIVRASGSKSMSSGADGSFAFSDVMPAAWVVTASTDDSRVAFVPSVFPDEGPVELPLQPGATLEVRMNGRRNARLAVFHDEVRVEDFTVRDGKVAEVVVPAGDLRLCLYGKDLMEERELVVPVGETRSLVFDVH